MENLEKVEIDDESCESSNENNSIQLGFAETGVNQLFDIADWTKWDGGRIGGQPIWLDLEHAPSSKELKCIECNEPMCFLLQIYSPMDHVESAFHRCLYVFTCKKPSCLRSSRGFQCIRQQLPRLNKHYCFEPKELSTTDHDTFSLNRQTTKQSHFCKLCGCLATSLCSKCRTVRYCSASHQKLHWKCHKTICTSTTSSGSVENELDECQVRYLFPQYDIVIEAEPSDGDNTDDDKKPTSSDAILSQVPKTSNVWEDAVTSGGVDEESDAKLTQADYNKALSETRYDPVYMAFLTRIQRPSCGQQVLRYVDDSLHRIYDVTNEKEDSDRLSERVLTAEEQEKGRLYLSKPVKDRFRSTIESVEGEASRVIVPRCLYCQSPRAFEFQIMPQLLHYLGVEKNTKIKQIEQEATTAESLTTVDGENSKTAAEVKLTFENKKQDDIDWGTIDIYTCIGNCNNFFEATTGSGYAVEHIELQDLPDLEGPKNPSSDSENVASSVLEVASSQDSS